MPKRTDISSILIIGAGPIVIGQACEFDYSGTQACKALKAEGYRIVLVNSNPATIMTDPDLADATYIEPITPEFVAKIIEKEGPDRQRCLPTMGGQTALNCALSLRKMGVLAKFNVEDDRRHRRGRHRQGGVTASCSARRCGASASETPRSHHIKTLPAALTALEDIGLPAIIRPSFTLGGTGGGIAYNKAEFIEIVERGIDASPTNEVLVEEFALGWKEYEMEVVRGQERQLHLSSARSRTSIRWAVHTGGDPPSPSRRALTLTDKEYQIMRDASDRGAARDRGGDRRLQRAVRGQLRPTAALVIIEMNPRVSRSSALASKATGFPIAKVAAKLAVGYTLDEIANDITCGATPASFEPSIDYVVTKIPRFAFEKFPGADPVLTTSMKSVGEVMAIGRTFQESLQKALRSLETGLTGLDEIAIEGLGQGDDKTAVRAALGLPTPDRLLKVAQAMRLGFSDEEICRILLHRSVVLARAAWHRRRRSRDQDQRLAGDGRRAALLPRPWAFPTAGSATSTRAGRGRGDARRRARARRCGRPSSASSSLRGRVRLAHRLHVLDLRDAVCRHARLRGGAVRQAQGHDSRRRAEPHRARHRVRRQLLSRRLCALAGRLRNRS